MIKSKTIFICQNCGAQSIKWIGKCSSCGEWNTYIEEIVKSEKDHTGKRVSTIQKTQKAEPISSISLSDQPRINTGCNEFNRVLGGGLVPGSLVLIGGEPGIGKSTLVLQVALQIGAHILYVSGEESPQQIRLRAERLKYMNDRCLILSETLLENVLSQLETIAPDLVIIDSIQTLYTEKIESSPGTVTQIRECTTGLMRFAKETNTPVLLIGHINKEGSIAGPKVLEHMVDTVLQFEGDPNYMYRILRSTKNRFGSTSELGIFEMHDTGLIEVSNPSELLLSHRDEQLSGISISSSIEGIRPFLIEVQALVSTTVYSTPQRSSTGFDLRRLNMLLAVLEKRAGFRLATKDVFLNMAGGIKVADPAIDLAVICSVLSSDLDLPIDNSKCFAAEIGLSGEIRPINRIEQRISEAEKLGFREIYISKYNLKALQPSKYQIKINSFGKIEEVFKSLFK
jgi:DNA repair protein RadA/Sms